MRNSRTLIQIFFIFLVITIFAFYIVNNFSSIQEKFGNNEKFKALIILFPTIPYVLAIVLLIFGWRYQDIGLLIATFSLGFLFYSFEINLKTHAHLLIAAYTLFPINMLIASSSHKKKIFSVSGLFWLIIFAIEIYLILIFCNSSIGNNSKGLIYSLSGVSNGICPTLDKSIKFSKITIPLFSLFTFVFSLIILIINFIKKKSSLLLGYLLTVLIIFFTFFIPSNSINITLFFSFGFIIVLIAMIDSSFLLAYIDELTGIAGRRSLEEDLKHLGKKTAVAMLDIDFFKKFNDKYGHKTGDQALKMVASRLSRASGNPKVYRYGGEEFTAIYTGKSAINAKQHMEEFRKELESADFIIRDTDRKKHTEEDRGKIKKQLRKTKITVSIGIAYHSKNLDTGEKLIKAADVALYKAKNSGRNTIKTYNKGIGDDR